LLYGDRARTLLAEHLPGVPLHVVYNGLDEEKLSACLKESRQEPVAEARRRLGCSEAERVLLFIGRLQPVKRLDLLIESVARLRARGRRVAALIVGEGEEEAALRQLCRDRDVVGDVHFLGPCHEERTTAGYFRAADVCVIPSGAGLTVMHSLSYETPVVTHDDFGEQFPEIEALRPGENALLFSHGDLESLVQALERALFPVPLKDGLVASGNALDERFTSAEQARRMVKAAHATVEAAHS
jgi:glycosyltransferase involved in cell wall biosynthesis